MKLINKSKKFVAFWCWKAGGETTSNDDRLKVLQWLMEPTKINDIKDSPTITPTGMSVNTKQI